MNSMTMCALLPWISIRDSRFEQPVDYRHDDPERESSKVWKIAGEAGMHSYARRQLFAVGLV